MSTTALHRRPTAVIALPATQAAPQEPAAKKKVILFFASDNDDLLHPEEREIEAAPAPAEEAGRVLQELIKGFTIMRNTLYSNV